MNKQGGDLQNTWKIFSKAMKKIGVSLKEYRVHALRDGDPTECTRLLRLVLMGISLEVAEQMLSRGLGQLSSDSKFINTAFRYLREQSAYIPVITTTQYHSKGFGEHKLLLIHAAAQHVMGYLALGGPRVPSDLHIPDPFSSPVGHEFHTPSSTGKEKTLPRSQSTPSSLRHLRSPGDESDEFDQGVHFRLNTKRSPFDDQLQDQPHHVSKPSPSNQQQINNRLPAHDFTPNTSPTSSNPCSPFEDPDATPNYRRAYRIEHSQNENDTITREEAIRLMQDLEKRLRREYDATIFLLTNRVKTLEDEMSKLQQASQSTERN